MLDQVISGAMYTGGFLVVALPVALFMNHVDSYVNLKRDLETYKALYKKYSERYYKLQRGE